MANESRLALLASVARDVGAVPMSVKPKHARNGAHLRLRVPSRESARLLNECAQSLGFYTGGVMGDWEGHDVCQLVVVVPANDLGELHAAIGGGREALPRPVPELTS